MNQKDDSNAKCLVLGCGYVGTAVARRWLAEGKEVWGVSRNQETLSRIRAGNFHAIVAEVDSGEWHTQVPSTPDVVLNCVSSAGGGLDGYRKSYLEGNRSLLEWSRRGEPRKIIYTGSTAVYPFSDGREVREEDAGGEDLADTGALVLESERMLLEDEHLGPRATVLRLAGIYGPGRHYLLDQLRRGDRVLPGRGDYFLNLIFLDDIVTAITAVAESGNSRGRSYNVSDGNPATKTEIVHWLADKLGIPAPTFDPDASGGRRMRINRAGSSPNRHVRIERIQNEIGWNPQFPTFREGFRRIGL